MTDIVWDIGHQVPVDLLQRLPVVSPDEMAERIGIRKIRCSACARQFVACLDATVAQQWRAHERQTGHGTALWSFGAPG